MRSLSAALAAQQKQGGTPYIKLILRDKPVESERLEWVALCEDAQGTEYRNHACIAPDGCFARARAVPAGGGTATIQAQRITDPAQPSQWTAAWATVATDGRDGSEVAIGRSPEANGVSIFYAHQNGQDIYKVTSTDNGATWSSAALVASEAAGDIIVGLAYHKHYSLARDALVYSVAPGGSANNQKLRLWWRDFPAAWQDGGLTADYLYNSVTSLACGWNQNGEVRVIIADGPPYRLSSRPWIPGSGWQSGVSLLEAGEGSGYQWHYPSFLTGPKSLAYGLRKAFSWVETGPTGGRKVCVAFSPAEERLQDWVPHLLALAPTYRHTLLRYNGYHYLIGSRQAYRAPYYNATNAQKADLSGRVVAFMLEDPGRMRPSRLTIHLDNADGRVTPANYPALREGSEVNLGVGYRLAGGGEVSYVPPFWIERFYYAREKGRAWVTLEGTDAWGYLEKLKAPRQIRFVPLPTVTVEDIATWICSWVAGRLEGFDLSPMVNTQFTSYLVHPGQVNEEARTFEVMAGEGLAGPLRRALRAAGCYLRFYLDASTAEEDKVVAQAIAPQAADASTYSYGPGAHPVLAARYGQGGRGVNQVEVYGDNNAFGEAFAFDHVKAAGRRLLWKVHDRKLDTSQECADRAQKLVEETAREDQAGWLEALPNVGQEIMDAIDITDPSAEGGLSAAKRRVEAHRLQYEAPRGDFILRLDLAAP